MNNNKTSLAQALWCSDPAAEQFQYSRETVLKVGYIYQGEKKGFSIVWEERFAVLTPSTLFLLYPQQRNVPKSNKIRLAIYPKTFRYFGDEYGEYGFCVESGRKSYYFRCSLRDARAISTAESVHDDDEHGDERDQWREAVLSAEKKRALSFEMIEDQVLFDFNSFTTYNQFLHIDLLKQSVAEQLEFVSPINQPRSLLTALKTPRIGDVKTFLQSVAKFDFDIFEFTKICGPSTLQYITSYGLYALGVTMNMKIQMSKLRCWINTIEKLYLAKNPFHNSTHAADVTQTMFFFLKTCRLNQLLEDEEMLACLVAAAAHDVSHPGVNNSFLAAIGHSLSVEFKPPILENLHSQISLKLLKKPKFQFLPTAQMKTLCYLVKQLILATDMSKHVQTLTDLKHLIGEGQYDKRNPQHRLVLMKCAIHCADVSNPLKPWTLYREWCQRLMREFYAQGDLEKKHNLSVSPFMERNEGKINTVNCQLYFMDAVSSSLFSVFGQFIRSQLPDSVAYADLFSACLTKNRKKLAELKENPSIKTDKNEPECI